MNILFLTSAAPFRAPLSTTEKRPPLGLASLMAVLKKEGHSIYFSDEYLNPSNILNSDFLEKNKIEAVGIYSNTICYDSTEEMLGKLQQKRVAGSWRGKILVGGPHTSIGASEIPAYVDHIVLGEGEVSAVKILSGQETGRIVRGEFVKDLDTLPFPAWEELIHRGYDWTGPWTDCYPTYTMNTSRGCPFNCSFCSVKAIWGKTYRAFSAERIVEDVERMITCYGAKGIYFREDNFTLDRSRVERFCQLLLQKNIKIDWMCETRAENLCDESFQRLMHKAGCRLFYIGVESGSPRMLEFYKKGETIEQFEEAFDIARRVGIRTYASFVVGFPTEEEIDVEMTEDLIDRIKPDVATRNVYIGLPGSELYGYIKEKGLYEYEDNKHILYPCGFAEKTKHYYGTYDFAPYHHSHFVEKRSSLTPRTILKKVLGRLSRLVDEK